MGAGAVSFAQIVKACEPVYVALLCLVVPPIEVSSFLAQMRMKVLQLNQSRIRWCNAQHVHAKM